MLMKLRQSKACKQLIMCITKRGNRALKNIFSKLTNVYSVTRKRSISLSYETFISQDSFWEKIKTKKFGLWPLSIKCDNTELLFYVTKLRMNKLRWDEFVPFDIIWKTSSGMDSHCSDCFISLSTESTHCNSSRSMGITWTRKMVPWF